MIEGMPDKLKEFRWKYGLSQKEVADHLGISASIVAGYETGYRTPSTEVLVKLSSLYQCSLDYLVGKTRESQIVIDRGELTDFQVSAIHTIVEAMKHG